ncbi:MAG: UbiA family prenyltransferase [Thermoprotei archaeon]
MNTEYQGWYPVVKGRVGGYLKVVKLHHAPLVEGPALAGALAFSGTLPPIFLRQVALIVIAALGFHLFGETYNELVGMKWHLNDPVKRPFVSGVITKVEGYIIIALGVVLLELASFYLNAWCFRLSPLVVLLTLIYPHLKDRFAWAPWALGTIVGIDVLGGYFGVWGAFCSSILCLLGGAPWLLVVSSIAFTVSFDETLNISQTETHRNAGIKEFSATHPRDVTLMLIIVNKVISAVAALIGCALLGMVPALFSLVFSSLLLRTVNMPKQGKIGSSINISLIAYATLVIGLAISHVLTLTRYRSRDEARAEATLRELKMSR